MSNQFIVDEPVQIKKKEKPKVKKLERLSTNFYETSFTYKGDPVLYAVRVNPSRRRGFQPGLRETVMLLNRVTKEQFTYNQETCPKCLLSICRKKMPVEIV